MSSKTKSSAISGSELTKKRKIDSSVKDQNRKDNEDVVDLTAAIEGSGVTDQNRNDNEDVVDLTAAIEGSGGRLPKDVLKRIEVEHGKVVIAGNVAWDTVGQKSGGRYELTVFQRLDDKMYRGVASCSTSAHSLLIDAKYKVYSFGLNQFGQLGQPKLETFNQPKKIEALDKVNIVQAACGHKHSLFLTDTGSVYACGDNSNGQLGIGEKGRNKIVTNPTRIRYDGAPIVKVGCGGAFSVILDIKGNLHTFGSPEYGQLGHNSDGQYFITSTKLAYDHVWTPRLITSYIEKTKQKQTIPITGVRIVDFACGKNHTIAIDSEKRAFSFGFGGYGRLGHNEVCDEWIPRLIKYMNVTVTGGAVRAYCGSTFSIVFSSHNNPYFFGKNNNRSTGQIYPKIINDLCGRNIKSVGCSLTSIVLADENDVIAWGASPTYGELGIGDMPKSSASPTFVKNLKGTKVSQVTMGCEHTLMIMNTDDEKTNEKYLQLPEFNMD